MHLTDTLASIDANIDDLQSGVEACSRTAKSIQSESDGQSIHGQSASLSRRAAELQACTRDQREALRELRDNVARLRRHLLSVTP